MKLKQLKPSASILRVFADTQGVAYAALKQEEQNLTRRLNERKDAIKTFAEEFGEQEGASMLIRGEEYAVGFRTSVPHEIDWQALFTAFPKYKQLVTRPMLSEAAIEEALKDGTLPKKLLAKFLTKKGKAIKTVVVQRLSKEAE